jgi:predicted nucleic acid-binding protein
MSVYHRPYVEASVWIAYIRGEFRKDGSHDCKAVFESILKAAQDGQFQIFTSSLTIAEVCKKKDAEKLTEDENEDLRPYFREEYITIVEVDRDIAERANDLCRMHLVDAGEHILRPNDAIHLACAERAGCEVLLAYDKHLTRWVHDKIATKWPAEINKVVMPSVSALSISPPVAENMVLALTSGNEPEDYSAKEKEANVFKASAPPNAVVVE